MELKSYFESTDGTGILSTTDGNGHVDAAIYSRPHFLENKIAFIMRDRLTHKNLESNPHAVYLFKDSNPDEDKFLVLFEFNYERPLIGDDHQNQG